MRHDWSKYGGLLKVLRNGGLEATMHVDACRDAADEIERLKQKQEKLRSAIFASGHKDLFPVANATV